MRKVAAGPSDLSQLPTDPPNQPIMRLYPAHVIGRKERRFTRKWYDVYKWIKYSVSMDATFCAI